MTRVPAALLALLALAGCGDGDGPSGTRPPAPGPRGPAARKDVATFSQIMFVYRGANGQTFKRTRPEALALANDMLRRIAQLSAAEVLVGHVEMPVNEGTSLESEGVYGPALAGVAHSYHHARGADVVDGLDRLARRKHVDLIAVLHRHIGLLAGMFHPSTAQELAQRIELPLLVLEQNRN